MRTEAILEQFGATEKTWRDIAVTHAAARRYGFIASESPGYAGRAIAALAADPARQRFSGGVLSSGTLSEIYDFTDVDGTRPNMNRYLAEHHPDLVAARSDVVEWQLGSIHRVIPT